MDKKGCVVLTSDDDDQVTYECYLCYREFQSAERLANHTTKSGHVDLMRKDFCSRDLWQYFPYPPDQGPEDFTICTRSVYVFQLHVWKKTNQAMALIFVV